MEALPCRNAVKVVLMLCLSYFNDAQVVTLNGLGTLHGANESYPGLSLVEAFKGIPYAKAPIGPLRFHPPQQITWRGHRNATKFGSVCPQKEELTGVLVGNEDCLFLNVYKPGNISSSSKVTVMVWIHGGAFVVGTSNYYIGTVLAAKHNVVVVTMNYRLGILGFFNAKGAGIKGNFGLLDQVAALQWVKNHIASFGGDPNKVTIFGESAGSASVSLHLVSPLVRNQGLFIRAIAQSGVATNPWAAYHIKDDQLAKKFASLLGCTDMTNMLTCLRGKSQAEVMQKQLSVNTTMPQLQTPNVDGHYLIELPWKQQMNDSLSFPNVDILLGFNEDEGTMFAGARNQTKAYYAGTMQYTLPMRYPKTGKILKDMLLHEYTKFYPYNSVSKWFESTQDFLRDFYFVIDTVNFANALAKKGKNVYLYRFTYLPQHLNIPYWRVAHSLELLYMFGGALADIKAPLQSNFTAADKMMSLVMMQMWTEFAKNGNPGMQWPKYTVAKKEYLRIDSKMKIEKNPWAKQIDLWGKLVPELINVGTGKENNCVKGTATILSHSKMLCFVLFAFSIAIALIE